MSSLAMICLGLWASSFILALYGTRRALKTLKPRLSEDVDYKPVSILKPLKGLDPDIKENLESFFRLDYPEFEIIFSVEDTADPVNGIVEELIKQYPNVHAKLICGAINWGPNPKVNNLIKSYSVAKYDFILITDSNVRVPEEYLLHVVDKMKPDVGVVTTCIAARDAKGLGGRLEAMCMNTFNARWFHAASALGEPMVFGKSMLFRRSVAELFGGLPSLFPFLAEDYMMGKRMKEMGLKIALMDIPVVQHIGYWKLVTFWKRQLRWGRLRKSHSLFFFLIEPAGSALVSGAIGAWALHHLVGFPFWAFFFLHIAIWAGCDALLMKKLDRNLTASSFLYWLLREILSVPLWIHILCGNTINWRGNHLALKSGGRLAHEVWRSFAASS